MRACTRRTDLVANDDAPVGGAPQHYRCGARDGMLSGLSVSQDDAKMVRLRLREAITRLREREQRLGREGFLSLPERAQNRLAVLQAQGAPKGGGVEAMLAAEHIIERYDQQLGTALDLASQIEGERGRVGARRRRRGLLVVAMLLSVGTAAVVGAVYYRNAVANRATACAKSNACAEDGLCSAGLRLAPPPVQIVCQAATDEACRASLGCREHGRCSVQQRQCAAVANADCARTESCRKDGWCSAHEGKCAALTVKDCRRIAACTRRGACTPVDELCKPGSDADCRQSEICRTSGACQEVDNRCVKLPEGFAK